jgi:hypothetical protein
MRMNTRLALILSMVAASAGADSLVIGSAELSSGEPLCCS